MHPVITRIANVVLIPLGLTILAIKAGMAPALLAGLLGYHLTASVSRRILKYTGHSRANTLGAITVGIIGILAISAGIYALAGFANSSTYSMHGIMDRLASLLERDALDIPISIRQYIPDSAEEFRMVVTSWLRENAREIRSMSLQTLHGSVQVLIALVIGILVGARQVAFGSSSINGLPAESAFLVNYLHDRVFHLSTSFKDIVYSQVVISGINTVITAIYVLVLLPMMGIHLPLAYGLVAFTFFAGLIPIAGNLISNTVIVMFSLNHSFTLAIGSLAYLVGVHKLEYFINARVVGSRIGATAWELLIAMLVMESLFGVQGILIAPIMYAWIKRELRTNWYPGD